jgi:hypothetical protein
MGRDHDRRSRPKIGGENPGATVRLARRIATLTGATTKAADFKRVFKLRSDFVHGKHVGLISPSERTMARSLACEVVNKLVDAAVTEPGLVANSTWSDFALEGAAQQLESACAISRADTSRRGRTVGVEPSSTAGVQGLEPSRRSLPARVAPVAPGRWRGSAPGRLASREIQPVAGLGNSPARPSVASRLTGATDPRHSQTAGATDAGGIAHYVSGIAERKRDEARACIRLHPKQ